MALYNIIQYNNEKHFRDNIELSGDIQKLLKIENIRGENYLEDSDIEYYFNACYQNSTNDSIIQTIKYAISHVNYFFDGNEFTFINPDIPEQIVKCNIGRILLFISDDDIYNLTSATSYYKKVCKVQKEISGLSNRFNNIEEKISYKMDREQEQYEKESYDNMRINNEIDNNPHFEIMDKYINHINKR